MLLTVFQVILWKTFCLQISQARGLCYVFFQMQICILKILLTKLIASNYNVMWQR